MIWNSLKITGIFLLSRVFLFSRTSVDKNWLFLYYFAKSDNILEISQLWLAGDGQEDKLVSSIKIWISKNHKISNSVRRKKNWAFPNFCIPMAGCYLLLPSSRSVTEKYFRSNEHTFRISTLIELQVRRKTIVYSLASRSRL